MIHFCFSGDDFDVKVLMRGKSFKNAIIYSEKGVIAKNGRYKGEPSPSSFIAVHLKTPNNIKRLEGMIYYANQFLNKNKKLILKSKVTHISIIFFAKMKHSELCFYISDSDLKIDNSVEVDFKFVIDSDIKGAQSVERGQ